MANRLADAASPYLRQHADNPVDWYEWSEAAFARARDEDKPVFLSVGYSSCHWCHVMSHESFDDAEVAALLNARFVPVKVDREERPDVDSIYMTAVQAMTGQGGWPMSVFTTPAGEPFFGGTYWPRDGRQGMPGFVDVLAAVDTAWREQRDQVVGSSARLTAHVRAAAAVGAGDGDLDPHLPERAAEACVRAWDRRNGGFGGAPKFPQAMTIDFLLAHHLRSGATAPLEAAEHTLTAMSLGGIYDHVAGGFARYSTDDVWLVPHFEKMLYDNALLLRAYAHAWQVTGNARLRRVAVETADYLLREMHDGAGGFYSATDADSEGVEGKFFTWSAAEFDEVVAAAGEDPAAWRGFFGVTEVGNFRDPHHPRLPATNVLSEVRPRDEDDAAFASRLDRIRAALYERRASRVPPGLDDKVLTSWNALALGALAEAGAALGEPRYVAAATDCATFLRDTLVVEGRLHHTWSRRHGARVPAFLEDVAYLAQALLALAEAGGEASWTGWAAELAADAVARFADDDGAYFSTAVDGEPLLTRPKDLWDNATPAGASVMADVHLRLAALHGDHALRERARETLALFTGRAAQAPTGYGELLRAVERFLAEPREVAIVGAADDPATAALVATYHRRWRPGSVLVTGTRGSDVPPLLAGRGLVDGRPAAYVCRDFACDRPVTAPDDLAALLER